MDLDNALEDGELSNDSGGYTPLERPATYSEYSARPFPVNLKKAESESDGQLSTSSESDSDSDSPSFRAKKPKVKVKKALPKPLGSKRRKYDVWSSRAQEDSLLAMTSCDVSQKDRSRDVETYDHTIARKYYAALNGGETDNMPEGGEEATEVKERMNNKRNRKDRKDASLRLMNRRRSSSDDRKGQARILMEVIKGLKSDGEVALEIANKLCEEKEDLIQKIVSAIGADKAIKIYMDVKRIEAEGGMLIMNQSRRRTPGGVYLFLLKHDDQLTPEQRATIFEDEKKNYKEYIKAKKKKKSEQIKIQIASSKAKILPELLTKAELVQKLSDKQWTPKDTADDVVNPPPTPETDGQEAQVDSGDADIMESGSSSNINSVEHEKYENDFLDLTAGNDMDMF